MTVNWEQFFSERPADMLYPSPTSPDADEEIVCVADLDAELELLYETGIKPGLNPGWPALAEYYTIRKREVTVVTGYPNHGKSTWMDNVVINMAVNHNWRWGVFSAENVPISRHIARLMKIYYGKPFSKGPTPRMEPHELSKAKQFIGEHVFSSVHRNTARAWHASLKSPLA